MISGNFYFFVWYQNNTKIIDRPNQGDGSIYIPRPEVEVSNITANLTNCTDEEGIIYLCNITDLNTTLNDSISEVNETAVIVDLNDTFVFEGKIGEENGIDNSIQQSSSGLETKWVILICVLTMVVFLVLLGVGCYLAMIYLKRKNLKK